MRCQGKVCLVASRLAGLRTLNQRRGMIVEKLIEYMCFKTYYENVGPKEEIPVKEFLERIPPEIVLEL